MLNINPSLIITAEHYDYGSYEIHRNEKTGKCHVVTKGYIQAWCGAKVNDYYQWSNRGSYRDVGIDSLFAASSYMCKRCAKQWRSK